MAIDHTKVEIDPTDSDTPYQYKRFNQEFCGNGSSIPDTCSNVTFPATIGWVSDSKDSAINPRSGAFQRANLEWALPGGDLTYYKLTYQHQRFFPVTRTMTLMLNGELGYAKGLSGQEVPFYKNFYAGGPSSVRGYEAASLGPYEMSGGDPVRLGGTKKFIFNSELIMPFPGMDAVRFGPFFDAGQVYPDGGLPYGVYDQGPVRMSTGLAATWMSPFGPLKFAIAKALNSEDNDKLQTFQFQMGQTF